MLFNSWIYFLFLPVVFAGYFALPHKWRWLLLLITSYVFYGWWKWEFLLLLGFSTAFDFTSARQIEKASSLKSKKLWLIFSLCINLGILFFFKYFYFFVGSTEVVQRFAHDHQSVKELIEFLSKSLPVGISFYTFQSMSYVLDVYYGRSKAERNLGQFAVFIAYFPQLVAGPIERFSHLNEQLKKKQTVLYSNIQAGFRLMLYGFFVKMVIADNLSYTVTSVFDNPGKWVYYWNIIGVLTFAFQIYADFFGYSLIAQGTAKLFGVDLMDNFNRPYLALGITDFWKRWHISLSTWFKDYLYIPLGGNRVSKSRWTFNVLLVFLLSGLWHGANYTFIVWGALHGIYYLIESFSPFKIKSVFSKGLLTFIGVCFAWIFFRAADFNQALDVMKGMLPQLGGEKQLDTPAFVFVLLAIFGAIELWRSNQRFDAFCNRFNAVGRWGLYAFLIFCILVLSGSEYQAFIYFRF